jgi:hypothetical protein
MAAAGLSYTLMVVVFAQHAQVSREDIADEVTRAIHQSCPTRGAVRGIRDTP